jgi:hypothetical protein
MQRRVVAGLVLVALALLVVVWWRHSSPPPRIAIAGERTAALRVDCRGDGKRCSHAAALHLVVSNGGRFRHVFAVGLDDRAAIHWYLPHPPDVVSAVAPLGDNRALGAPLPLAPEHLAGKLRVYALFSDAPVSAQEVTAATAVLKSQQRLPSSLETLPIARTDVLQTSVLLDVTP